MSSSNANAGDDLKPYLLNAFRAVDQAGSHYPSTPASPVAAYPDEEEEEEKQAEEEERIRLRNKLRNRKHKDRKHAARQAWKEKHKEKIKRLEEENAALRSLVATIAAMKAEEVQGFLEKREALLAALK